MTINDKPFPTVSNFPHEVELLFSHPGGESVVSYTKTDYVKKLEAHQKSLLVALRATMELADVLDVNSKCYSEIQAAYEIISKLEEK